MGSSLVSIRSPSSTDLLLEGSSMLPVLATHIRTLPKYLPRIMTGPENLQKLFETNQPGIIFNLLQ